MNERIRLLAEQAGVEFDESFSSEPETIYYLGLSHFEKFAELIIRECADIASMNQHQYEPVGLYVLKHFGVKE